MFLSRQFSKGSQQNEAAQIRVTAYEAVQMMGQDRLGSSYEGHSRRGSQHIK